MLWKIGKVSLNGTRKELIVGLSCHVLALLKNDIEFKEIEWACKEAKEEYEKENNKSKDRINTVYTDENFKVQEINAEGMTKEELKKLLLKLFE